MANIHALAGAKREVEILETVRDVREFMDRDKGEKPIHPIRLEIPGSALRGHATYRDMLTEEFNAVLPELNERIKKRLRSRELAAKDMLIAAVDRL